MRFRHGGGVDLRHLRYFVTVAEERHVGRAAERLHLAQPALSRQIHDLESELGAELLVRHPAGVDVTRGGAVLLDEARDLLAGVDAAVARALHAADGSAGRLRIGVSRYHLRRPAVYAGEAEIRRRFPALELEMVESEPGLRQWQLLRARKIDLAIGAAPPATDRSVRWELLMSSAIDGALLPAGHPLASRESIEVRELSSTPLLFPSPEWHPDLVEAVQTELQLLGHRAPALCAYSGPNAVFMAVGSGFGWCPVPLRLADPPLEGAVTVPLRGFHVPLIVAAIWRAAEDRPAVLCAVEIFRAAFDPAASGEPVITPPRTGRRPPGLRSLEARHLRALAALRDATSLGTASRRLRIAQPTVARQLTELERIVRTTLVVRSPGGTALTPAGASLSADAARLIARFDRLAHRLGHPGRHRTGRCIIGAVAERAAAEMLGCVMRASSERHHGIKLLVQDVNSAHQVRALHEGRIDVGLGYRLSEGPPPRDIAMEPLTHDVIDCALLGTAHRLAARRSVSAEELRDIPFLFIARSYHPGFHDRVLAALARLGLSPRVDSTCNGLSMIFRMAAEGRGWALGFGTHHLRPPLGTVAVEVAGLSIPWGLVMHWRRDEPSEAVRATVSLLRAQRNGHP